MRSQADARHSSRYLFSRDMPETEYTLKPQNSSKTNTARLEDV
jgi:hypothetical protein